MKWPTVSVREAFRVDVLRSSLITDGTRILLLHMATVPTVTQKDGHPMTDKGRIKVCRQELADALGIDVGAVSDRIRKATSAGLLVKVAGGQNAQVVVYQAQPRGYAKGTSYTGPASLCGFVNVPDEALVGTPTGVPGMDSEGPVGTPASAPYAHAHYVKNDAHPEPAPDGARASREDDVTEQAGNYRGWPSIASRRLFGIEVVDDGSSERFPDERPTGEVA